MKRTAAAVADRSGEARGRVDERLAVLLGESVRDLDLHRELPDAALALLALLALPAALLAVIGIIYGAAVSYAQQDIKKLVAYSSVSHLGFVMLGLFALNPQGIQGGILQMINHGVTTGALFICIGIIYERTHSRMLSDNAALGMWMPIYVTFLVVFALS